MTSIAGAGDEGSTDATRARLDVGDPLRALAALAVFGIHLVGSTVAASGYSGQLVAPDHFASLYGWIGYAFDSLGVGVQLFFVLSGYLLTRPFLRAYIGDEPLPSIPSYLRNRALRILPAFWVVLILAFVVYGTRGDTFWQSVGLAALVSDFRESGIRLFFGQPWSLAVEARFYLLLPVAALVLVGLKRLLGRRLPRSARIVLVLALIALGYHASAGYAGDNDQASVLITSASYFGPGMILAVLEHVLASRVRSHPRIRFAAPLLFVVGLALSLSSFYLLVKVLSPTAARYLLPIPTGLLLAGPLLWQWAGAPPWRALDNSALRRTGLLSYSLFLVHGLFLFGLAPHLVVGGYKLTLLALGAAALTGSLIAAALIYRFVERPALNLKTRSTLPPVRPPAPVAGEVAGLGSSAA